MTGLAITARFLEQDLSRDLKSALAEHVVEILVERRGQDPESREALGL